MMNGLTRRITESRRAACALALVFAFAAAAGAQQDERQAQARKKVGGSSTARGRVLYADTDEPVRRARVTLLRLEILTGGTLGRHPEEGVRTTATDGRGEFYFGKLEAGRYAVGVSAPDVVTPQRGGPGGAAAFDFPSGPADSDERVFDLDGTNGAEKTIRVRRGGALSGRVFYADGDAATNATAHLFCRVRERWARCGAGVSVDDRGQYRFEGLASGEYVVGVAENNIWSERSRRINLGTTTFLTAYHPSATSPRGAEAVRVEAGRETEGVDVTFGEGLRRVSGVARWRRDGRPATDALVRLQSLEDVGDGAGLIFPMGAYALARGLPYTGASAAQTPNDMTESTDAEGRWAFDDLPDGKYVLTLMVVAEEKRERTSRGERGSTHWMLPTVIQRSLEVNVAGGDVTGLSFQLAEGGRVSGVVTFEGGASPPASRVYVIANQKSSAGRALPSAQLTDEDGTFEIGGLADGEVFISAFPAAGDTLYVKSISGPDGADLTRTPLRVGEESGVAGVRIVISSDAATLAGRVVGRDGRAHAGGVVFLVPADQSLRGAGERQCLSLTGGGGDFKMNCPPGDYLLYVTRAGDAWGGTWAEAAGARAGPAMRVTLRPNERREVEVAAPESQ